MGMHVKDASGAGADDSIIDINTTPLIDVLLVLLVMLIITIPIQLHSVKLNLPLTTPPPSEVKPEVVKIDIDEISTIYWNGVPVTSNDELVSKMQASARQSVQPEVHVRPHQLARYDSFVEVMVALEQNGLRKMGVVGSEQFIEP